MKVFTVLLVFCMILSNVASQNFTRNATNRYGLKNFTEGSSYGVFLFNNSFTGHRRNSSFVANRANKQEPKGW